MLWARRIRDSRHAVQLLRYLCNWIQRKCVDAQTSEGVAEVNSAVDLDTRQAR